MHGIVGITPVKMRAGGCVLNKAGRLVLKGDLEGRPVKIYEAANSDHALFIQSVSLSSALVSIFPKVIAVYGPYLVTDWILANRDSRTLSATTLMELQKALFGASTAGAPEPGFDYWQDLIRPRFVRAADLLGKADLAQRVCGEIDVEWSASSYLMHPDLRSDNVVRDRGGLWRIIDNELMTVGGLPLLDICNTASSLPAGERDFYVAAMAEHLGIRQGRQRDIIGGAWLARLVSSCFFAGDVHRAADIVGRYERGDNILPFARDIF